MKFVNSDPHFLPPAFIDKMKELLPESEFNNFVTAMNTRLRKCIRINTLKANYDKTKQNLESYGFSLEQMPWYKYGFFAKDDDRTKKLGNTLEHFLGQIYVQEASSMLPVIALDPQENDAVLDIAAAPGSKTTQISMHMNNTGTIVANEPQLSRISALQENLERNGALNHVITRNDGRIFRRMPDCFDCVLVDAPCSVEGTFRKDIKARHLWAPNKVSQLAKLQYELLKSGIIAAKKDATIIYSTCTLSPEENELVINKALKEDNVQLEKINLKGLDTSKGIIKYRNFEIDKELEKTVRIWPHKTDMEGFYLAKLRKI